MLKFNKFGGAALMCVIVSAIAGSAWGANPPSLANRWVLEEGGRAPAGFPGNMELLKDGSCIVDGKSRTWKTEGARFYFMGDKALAFDYKMSGGTLTLTNDDGKGVAYLTLAAAKKAEDAKEAAAMAVKTGAGTLTDTRNGKTYKTVKIAGKAWMAENLNYQTGNSWCYGGNAVNCGKYGRLYDWNSAMKACPSGWHLPSNQEWAALLSEAGGHLVAGKKMKAASGWSNNGNGTDVFGFSATPGGNRRNDGKYYGVGNDGSWWSSTENEGDLAYYRGIFYASEKVYEFNYDKGYGFSVRCAQD
jgi:uncharacterized protein (TIGR02145 family)